jgi:hypothetical protein
MRFPQQRLPILIAAAGAAILALAAIVLVSGDDDEPLDTGAAAEATPMPTSTPSVEVRAGCDEWPAEVAPIIAQRQITLPEGLCLRTAESPAAMPEGCQQGRGCYVASTTAVWRLSRAGTALLPNAAAEGSSEASILAHELCHAHQHRQVVEADIADASVEAWPLTEEGEAYWALAPSLPDGFVLVPGGPIESFANVCAAWLLPNEPQRITLVLPHVPLVNFLQTWLVR